MFKGVFNYAIYGCFETGLIEINKDASFNYNMQYAYLLSILAFFIYWITMLSRK